MSTTLGVRVPMIINLEGDGQAGGGGGGAHCVGV